MPDLTPNNVDVGFLYQIIRDMDMKLDRLIDTFATVRELDGVKARVTELETRWRRNAGWVVALIGALSSIGYLIVYVTK